MFRQREDARIRKQADFDLRSARLVYRLPEVSDSLQLRLTVWVRAFRC